MRPCCKALHSLLHPRSGLGSSGEREKTQQTQKQGPGKMPPYNAFSR